jgi:hypothetical protein
MDKNKKYLNILAFTGIMLLIGLLQPLGATQVHADPEGLVAHQIAHVVFAVSMGILIYWLREWDLVKQTGWRLVQYSALFFILWNIDAFIVHYLDERGDIYHIINAGSWHARVQMADEPDTLALLYYVVKLDHLLCVPAVLFLYAGLRQLIRAAQTDRMVDRKP